MTTIYWAGDSTVKENSILTYPQTGMGQVFGRFVRRLEVRVENHAENGRSTKSFLEEGRLETIRERMQPGDFLFIQFGHNDEKAEDPARYTSPEDTFRGYLAVFVKAAREKGAYPVMITPLTRRCYRDPQAKYSHGTYAAAMLELARELCVPLIDLTAESEKLVDRMGEDAKQLYMNLPAGRFSHYPDGLEDNTHLQPAGALAFAGLVAEGLQALGGVYAALLSDEACQWMRERAEQRTQGGGGHPSPSFLRRSEVHGYGAAYAYHPGGQRSGDPPGAGPVAGAGGNGNSGGGTPEPLGGPGGEPGNAPAAGGIRHQGEPECRG